MLARYVAEIIVGVIASLISGIILSTMRPSYVSFRDVDGDLLVWCTTCVLGLLFGMIAAFIVASGAQAMFIEMLGPMTGDAEATGALAKLCACVMGLCIGVMVAVGAQRGIWRAWQGHDVD